MKPVWGFITHKVGGGEFCCQTDSGATVTSRNVGKEIPNCLRGWRQATLIVASLKKEFLKKFGCLVIGSSPVSKPMIDTCVSRRYREGTMVTCWPVCRVYILREQGLICGHLCIGTRLRTLCWKLQKLWCINTPLSQSTSIARPARVPSRTSWRETRVWDCWL